MTNNENKTGSCTLCDKKAECKCERCGDFYCSEFCQLKDWSSHRFICFPMPKLVKVRQRSTSNNIPKLQHEPIKKSTNLPPNGSCVILTGFKALNRCFIRSTNPSTVAEYEKAASELNEFGKNSSVLEKPKPNSFALALRGDKWCRVQVLGAIRDNYRISFLDFGDTSTRYLRELREISQSLASLPSFVQVVQLKGIKYLDKPHLMRQLIKYTNKEYKVEFVQPDKAGGNVELFLWGTTTLLNSLLQALSSNRKDNDTNTENSAVSSLSRLNLQKNGSSDIKDSEIKSATEEINPNKNNIQQGLKTSLNGSTNEKTIDTVASTAELKQKVESNLEDGLSSANKTKFAAAPRQIQKACLIPPFEIIPLNENDRNSKIIIIDNSYIESGYIGCLLETRYENLKNITKFLKEYNVGDQQYKPKLHEYCLANFENEWYRAKVVETLPDDKFLVVYIDFTNEMELTSESIRRYPMSLKLPCCTTLCAIDGLPDDISDEVKNFLDQFCADFPIINIDSVRIVDDIHYVKSDELLNKMRNSKLL